MMRAMWAVPAAAVIAAAGAAAVVQANPAPQHHGAASSTQSASAVTAHRGTVTDPAKAMYTRNSAITAAVKGSRLLGEVPASVVSVRSIRVAAADGTWASAVAHPTDQRTDDAFVALHRVRGNWTVVMLGTAGVGCSVPTALRSDLHLACEPGL